MPDQAFHLRALVRAAAQADAGSAFPPPRKVVVCGGKGGAGATTIAVNLAIALARLGSRVVLVDADMNHADIAAHCQLETRDTIADVLSARRTVHEVLTRGPAGIQIVAGAWSATNVPDCSPAAQDRLLTEVDRLGRHADLVVLDVGGGLNHVVHRFWQAADVVLLVTTPDRVAIMDAYAAIKVLGDRRDIAIHVLTNRADAKTAAQVHARINGACERFLNCSVLSAGNLSDDPAVADAVATGRPIALDGCQHQAAREIEAIAERLLLHWRGGATPPQEYEPLLTPTAA
jgi:flagellar biosynthesis protein FlhG